MSDERRSAGHPHEESPGERFDTDTESVASVPPGEDDVLEREPIHGAVLAEGVAADLSVLDVRPAPGPPREYRFPAFERARLDNGLTVVACHMPGRPLLAASLVLPGGGALEPAGQAGVTVLMARALTEGTRRRSAIDFVEAAERLGAEVHADATWDAVLATLEVPRSRFAPALELLAEMWLEAAFPGQEVDRLREERLNDLLQARADPRRRAERAFGETVFDADVAYSRPLAGTEATVPALDREAVAERHRALVAGTAATLVVAGDLTGLDVPALVADRFAEWSLGAADSEPPAAAAHPAGPRTVLVDKRDAPQTELRIGHLGVSRRTPDFHALSVMNAILGGTFDSRLNLLLREERGYTYSISSAFEMRRARGPFVVRCAVHSSATLPAVGDILDVLGAMRHEEVSDAELSVARDYLVGVFPLRFESAAQVCAALAGLVVHDLPDDELDRYRPAISAVERSDVTAAAAAHVRPDEMSLVLVGDATALEPQLRDSDLPPLGDVVGE